MVISHVHWLSWHGSPQDWGLQDIPTSVSPKMVDLGIPNFGTFPYLKSVTVAGRVLGMPFNLQEAHWRQFSIGPGSAISTWSILIEYLKSGNTPGCRNAFSWNPRQTPHQLGMQRFWWYLVLVWRRWYDHIRWPVISRFARSISKQRGRMADATTMGGSGDEQRCLNFQKLRGSSPSRHR